MKLNRRGFLRALPAAPIAAKAAAVEATKDAVVLQQLAQAGMGVAPGMAMPWGVRSLIDPKMYALHKAGLLPEWTKNEVQQSVKDQARMLAPDVVALKSVSLSAKYRINVERMERSVWSGVDEWYLMEHARQQFWRNSM